MTEQNQMNQKKPYHCNFRKLAIAAFLATLSPSHAFLTLHSAVSASWKLHSKAENDSIATSNSNTNAPLLPDYGKTSVDIDQITIDPKQKWRRKDLFGTTLLDQTMEDLQTDQDFILTTERLKTVGAEQMTKEERIQHRRALDSLGVLNFNEFLAKQLQPDNGILQRQQPQVLQINIGLYCNQACGHCHVESSPLRKEMMSAETAAQCLRLIQNTPSITTLDITGGAPELNQNFRYLVRMARQIRPDIQIIDRCNLTVLQEPGQEDLVQFLKENKVNIIASMPCYSEQNVDQQRGNGVFDRSIAALLALNEAGYGTTDALRLDLVYNPLGAFLPPPQAKLEEKYHQVLEQNFGILFHSLFTMTNMPIKRFADFLHRRDELKDYMDLLVRNFNKDTTKSLMCLNTVSVGYNGNIFDCDFNQQLGYGIGEKEKVHDTGGISVFDIESLLDLQKYAIRNDNHCFGCTAGMGSS